MADYIFKGASLDIDVLAYRAMKLARLPGWNQWVTTAELLIELPGNIYLFVITYQDSFGNSGSLFVINGGLTFLQVDNPEEFGLLTDGKYRLILYFGHLLLYCFCKPEYKAPFPLRSGIDSEKFVNSIETKKYFVSTIKDAIAELGFSSLEQMMPIVGGLEVDGNIKLDGKYYQGAIKRPIEIQKFLNFNDSSATETDPRLYGKV